MHNYSGNKLTLFFVHAFSNFFFVNCNVLISIEYSKKIFTLWNRRDFREIFFRKKKEKNPLIQIYNPSFSSPIQNNFYCSYCLHWKRIILILLRLLSRYDAQRFIVLEDKGNSEVLRKWARMKMAWTAIQHKKVKCNRSEQ